METNQHGNLSAGQAGDQNGHTPGPESTTATFGATGLQPQDQPIDQTLTTRQGHPLTNN